MVKIEVLQRRIDKAEEYLNFLKNIKDKYSNEEFKENPMIYGSTERFLHLIIETLMDIGNHIISDQNLGKVDFYKDIPELLFEGNYINEELKDIFIKIIGFRNILVHDYLEIDHDIVYSIIRDDLNDLKEILINYTRLL